MSVGDLVALNGYTALVFGPLAQLANNWNTIQNGLTTIHDVQEILSTGPEAYDRPSGITPPQWDGAVVFDRVTFAYPDATDRTVLDDVSFIIKDGQTVAFVGESGVGKSTVTELIGGYYYPTEGEVLVSGVKTTEVPLRALREHIAVVPQEPALFNDTVLNNIRFGREQASDEEVIAAAKQAFAHEFIESFPEKYQQVVGERGVRLSVGQKQRIAIARAILRDPRILILDEPTSALDAKTEAYIAESLKALMKGRTTIVIAHRLSTVRSADNIIVFEQGKVVEQGTHAELLERTAGVYRTLHEHQVGFSGGKRISTLLGKVSRDHRRPHVRQTGHSEGAPDVRGNLGQRASLDVLEGGGGRLDVRWHVEQVGGRRRRCAGAAAEVEAEREVVERDCHGEDVPRRGPGVTWLLAGVRRPVDGSQR
jgi:ABC-type multidrug transport system fused ATPase/permease subunit